MKILKLLIKNLASLKGEYEIDFEAIENDGGGVYAICGPTGSGKSTILDGICLALYGQTPRLLGNMGSDFEAPIMSRGCGECRAAVEFSLKGHRYRSSWRQYRARGKADGKLQSPQVELARLDEPACILTTKKQEHREEMIRLTGLDFGRFTKVVMLAQGQFQNFLKMDDSGRGELLEKITGTEIYSEISRQVYQITAEHQKKRNDLEEELVRLRGDLGEGGTSEEMAERCRELTAEAESVRKQQELRQTAERWRQECEELQAEEQILVRAEAEIAPLRQRLQLARQAEAVYREVFILLKQTRERSQEFQRKILQAGENLQACQVKLRQAGQEKEGLEKQFSEAESSWAALKTKLPEVRQLDSRLASQQLVIQKEQQNFEHLQAELEKSREALRTGEESRTALAEERLRLEHWRKEHQAEEGLEENLQKFAGWVEQYQALASRRTGLEKQAGNAGKAVLDSRSRVARASAEAEGLGKNLAELDKKKQELEPEQKELLEGAPVMDPELFRDQLEQRRRELAEALDAARRLLEKQAQVRECRQKALRQQEDFRRTSEEYQVLEAELQADEKRLEHLKDLIQFVTRVAGAERLRKELREGVPCPVCGALDHPYAAGAVPELSDEVSESRKLERKLSASHLRLGKLKGRLEASEELRRQAEEQSEQDGKCIVDLEKAWRQALPGVECTPEEFSDNGAERLEILDCRLEQLREFIRRRNLLHEEYRCCQLKCHQAETGLTEARAGLRIAEAEAKQKEEQLNQCGQEALSLLQRYAGAVKEFITADSPENLADLQSLQGRLQEICNERRVRLAEFEGLMRRESALEGRLEILRQRLPGQEQEAGTAEGHLREQRLELERIQDGRSRLFGALDPDLEEKNAAARLEKVRGELSRAKESVVNLEGRLREMRAEKEKLQAEQESCREELEMRNQNFLAALNQQGFQDEEDWTARRCSSAQMDFLAGKCEEWTRQQTRYQTNLNRCRDQEQRIPEDIRQLGREALQEEIARTTALYQEKQQQVGRLQEQLELIRRKGLEITAKEQQLEEVRTIHDRWQELNAMIGSGGGDKFRRIVQGVTLDLVLEQANRQLAKMMDRYELLRSSVEDEKKCLDLKIVDHWQNDGERDIRNISGGESFVVSLALALGLSALKQGNLQVQSLFLDEGFGSLDEKNLENTVQMLAGLNQAGRQIGLISHVEALKESVGTRIDVIPRENTGVSTLSGIGCTRLQS